VERGVHVRALYQSSVRGDRRMMEYIKWFTDLGAEVRVTPVIPIRIILVDRAAAVVARVQGRLPAEIYLIREAGILAPLYEYFELSWAAAEPFEMIDARETDAEGRPTNQELALLQLLAAGSIDDAAAKKLGISVRTVRRMMADLMERLGATSRFEAGYKATKRGWL
jgi:DNA-binding NarL/FixJ family response regulator